jgi:hypothetical protein
VAAYCFNWIDCHSEGFIHFINRWNLHPMNLTGNFNRRKCLTLDVNNNKTRFCELFLCDSNRHRFVLFVPFRETCAPRTCHLLGID